MTPGDKLRIKVGFTYSLGDHIENLYYLQLAGALEASDSDVLQDCENWTNHMIAALDNIMTNSFSVNFAQVDQVGWDGVYNTDPELNTAKIVTVRNIGSFAPAFTPAGTSEAYVLSAPATVSLRTEQPKSRGRKAIGGFGEAGVSGGLLTNPVVTQLVLFALSYYFGPAIIAPLHPWLSGVISMKDGSFLPFTGINLISNILGIRDSRKIGRGS